VHGLLELRNSYGTLLASNDDDTTHYARIAFTVSSTGTFTTGAS
jgi:selenocysteine-specific translation elongation factor